MILAVNILAIFGFIFLGGMFIVFLGYLKDCFERYIYDQSKWEIRILSERLDALEKQTCNKRGKK